MSVLCLSLSVLRLALRLAGLVRDGRRVKASTRPPESVVQIWRLIVSAVPQIGLLPRGCDVVLEAFEACVGAEAEPDILVGDQVPLGVPVVPRKTRFWHSVRAQAGSLMSVPACGPSTVRETRTG